MEGAVEDDRWSSIVPLELLELILKRLSCCLSDCIRFGVVCKLWRSILLENQHLLPPCTPILLFLPSEDHISPNRELLDVTTNRLYKLPPLSEAHSTTIFGSSFGWLLTLEYSTLSYRTQLLNPLNRAQISLPSATTFANFHHQPDGFPNQIFIDKAVLSSNPRSSTDGNCVVMAIHGCERVLGFCRVGDERWTTLESKWLQFDDVIYVDRFSQFYAVTQSGIVVSWDPSTDPKMVEVAQPPRSYNFRTKYLVESSGDLLMVTRDKTWDNDGKYETSKFTIDRLDIASHKWENVTGLDDQVLFLGHNASISVSYHDMSGCKPNCIYFLDDHKEGYLTSGRGCYDMGVYCLDDNSIQPFSSTTRFWPSPMFWITPTMGAVDGLDMVQTVQV